MKTRFLILAFACLFLQSEARLFGGVSKFLGLEQDADDIAGFPGNTAPTHEGDTPHARAGGLDIQKTSDIIQTEISNGLRKDFQFIRDSLTAFADEEGFVREGIVFCAGEQILAPQGTDYHPDTGSLNMIDGYGNDITAADDANACGKSKCEEGSFVSLIANRIRALGYHVTHSDICQARATTALPDDEVHTARTCKLKSNNNARKAYSCSKADFDDDHDYFQVNQKCYKAKDSNACADVKDKTNASNPIKMCEFDEHEDICVADYNYVSTKCKNGGDKPGENILADGAEVNAVRRVISYSIKNPGDVPLTDKTYVTGVRADSNGNNACKSLRQYVAALNGMAQINAFRDVNIEEAVDNWAETIKEARTFIESYAAILSDFYDQSLLIFPAVEFEEMEDCPMGDVEKTGKDSGSKTAPLCDNKDYDSADAYNKMTSSAQAIIRSNCFCRKGMMDSTVENYEADDFYLSVEEKGGNANCSHLTALPSVYQFCEHGNLEARRWKDALADLEPSGQHIKVFGTNQAQKEADILNKLQGTLPLTSQSTFKANCGRLVSSDEDEMLYSNKGGNCVPFPKMNDLLYRLEFETSKADSGTMRGNTGTFADTLCKKSDKLANTMYTFRQLAYQWDHARLKNINVANSSPEVPSLSDQTSSWSNSGQSYDASSFADQLFSFGNTRMCNIDWTEEIAGETSRKDSAGSAYSDPYLLFDREVEEAIFNADVAVQAKKKTAAANQNLWSAIEAELTAVDAARINSKISFEAAEHFMRIVTTDADDKAVDAADNDGANGAATENPDSFGICGLQSKAGSNSTCTACGNGAAVGVSVYTSSSAAGKLTERLNKRSEPASDFKSGVDTNTAACAACAVTNDFNDNGVCVTCPGQSTKEVGLTGLCDVTPYKNTNTQQTVVNTAAKADQSFTVSNATSNIVHVYNSTSSKNTVEFQFSVLKVKCDSGYADTSDGKIVERDVGAINYDLANPVTNSGVGSAGNDQCVKLEDLLNGTDQTTKPLTNNLKESDAFGTDSNKELFAITKSLENRGTIETNLDNYLNNATHTDYWGLLGLKKLNGTGKSAIDPRCTSGCDGAGTADDIAKRDHFDANVTAFKNAQTAYNIARDTFEGNVDQLVDAITAMKNELGTQLSSIKTAKTEQDDAESTNNTKSGTRAFALAKISTLGNTYDDLVKFTNGPKHWTDGVKGVNQLTPQAVAKQKEYRKEWRDLYDALIAYGSAQKAADGVSITFGTCFTNGTKTSSFEGGQSNKDFARECDKGITGSLTKNIIDNFNDVGVGSSAFSNFTSATVNTTAKILADKYAALKAAHSDVIDAKPNFNGASYADATTNAFDVDDPDDTNSGKQFYNVYSTLQGLTNSAF